MTRSHAEDSLFPVLTPGIDWRELLSSHSSLRLWICSKTSGCRAKREIQISAWDMTAMCSSFYATWSVHQEAQSFWRHLRSLDDSNVIFVFVDHFRGQHTGWTEPTCTESTINRSGFHRNPTMKQQAAEFSPHSRTSTCRLRIKAKSSKCLTSLKLSFKWHQAVSPHQRIRCYPDPTSPTVSVCGWTWGRIE